MRRIGHMWLWCVAIVLAVALNGCGAPPAVSAPSPAGVSLRVVHAAPGATRASVSIDGSVVARGLRSGEAADFVVVEPGTRTLAVFDADSSAPVFSTELVLADGSEVNVVLTGKAGALTVAPVVSAFAPPRDGRLRLRVLHAAPGLGPVSFDFGDDGAVDIAALSPGFSSTAEGIEGAANTLVPLRVVDDHGPSRHFTVPALPAHSELLLVLTEESVSDQAPGSRAALLGIAPSAVLGFLRQEPNDGMR